MGILGAVVLHLLYFILFYFILSWPRAGAGGSPLEKSTFAGPVVVYSVGGASVNASEVEFEKGIGAAWRFRNVSGGRWDGIGAGAWEWGLKRIGYRASAERASAGV